MHIYEVLQREAGDPFASVLYHILGSINNENAFLFIDRCHVPCVQLSISPEFRGLLRISVVSHGGPRASKHDFTNRFPVFRHIFPLLIYNPLLDEWRRDTRSAEKLYLLILWPRKHVRLKILEAHLCIDFRHSPSGTDIHAELFGLSGEYGIERQPHCLELYVLGASFTG